MPTKTAENGVNNPQFENRTIRVFISSTFRDMHAERDYLVKFTFPKLRKLCEERGVTWGDVDLRWGVTDEQAAEGKVLPVCLEEIKRCKPYFIGLLGERYGWVPDTIPQELIDQEDWLEKFKGAKSVTELEILHGVLNEPKMAGHAFFYFRDPVYIDKVPDDKKADFICEDDKSKQKLTDLKKTIRASGFPVRENFPTPEELGKLVLEDLTKIIDRLYPEGSNPGYMGRENMDHEAYAKSRALVYIGRDEYFDNLDEHAEADYTQPLVITGESGSGKSALLANWAKRYKENHPDSVIIQHYIGTSRNSADCIAMLRRVLRELKWRIGIEQNAPETAEDILRDFPNWLYAASARGRIILIIDALNQLENSAGTYNLAWLPHNIPPNVRLFIATLPGEYLDECIERDWPGFEIEPLDIPDREKVITAYLKLAGKQLADHYVKLMVKAEPTGNSLYLKTLLDELKVFGQHGELANRINKYLEAADPEQLYEKIIARWEKDYEEDTDLVGDALSLIWASRQGLSGTELLYALGTNGQPLPRAKWSPLYLAMTGCLVNHGGLLNFAHDYVRGAVEASYIPTQKHQIKAHLKLADYFEKEKGMSPRKVFELPWQLREAGEKNRLRKVLLDIPTFLVLFEQDKIELIGYWVWLGEERNMGGYYLESFEKWSTNKSEKIETADKAIELAEFLNESSLYLEAEALIRHALAIDEHSFGKSHPRVALDLNNLGQLLQAMNKLSDAELLMRRALDIDEQNYKSNHPDVARDLGNLALLLLTTNRIAEAEPLIRRSLVIDEQCYGPNHPDVARDLSSLAQLLYKTNRLNDAEPLWRRAILILLDFNRETGQSHPQLSTLFANYEFLLNEMGWSKEKIFDRVVELV